MADGLNWMSDSTDEEIARGCIAGWRANVHRAFYDGPDCRPSATDPALFAMMDLVEHDPGRALNILFLVARVADDPHTFIALGVGPLTDLTKADPTLWDAIALETQSNPKLLSAVGQVFEAEVPDALWIEYLRSLGLQFQ